MNVLVWIEQESEKLGQEADLQITAKQQLRFSRPLEYGRRIARADHILHESLGAREKLQELKQLILNGDMTL